ncbi:extracellular matrix protein [Neofusicoccum parvum]|nr:extracellular matrix protein [Neofusicoccum parvum]
MRFFQSIVGAFALASSVVAQTAPALGITSAPTSVTAGQTYTIEYAAPVGQPVALLLRKGDPNDLQTVATLTDSATGGSYEWSVSQSLESDDDYALEIQQGTSSNYYGPFSLSGGAAASSSASSSSASASASASASGSSTESSTITASASLSSAAASLSSLISAANSTLASITSAANATITSSNSTATPASNSTTLRTSTATSTTSGSSGSSSTGGSSTASSTGSAPTSGAAMPSIASPIALIFGAVAAIVFLN